MPDSFDIETAYEKARQVHYGDASSGRVPGAHSQDDLVTEILEAGLAGQNQSSRAGRQIAHDARRFWGNMDKNSPTDALDQELADKINRISEQSDGPAAGTKEARLEKAGLLSTEDDYTSERVGNRKSEILTRRVTGLIPAQTPIVNNFFTVIPGGPDTRFNQLTEFVTYAEEYSGFNYYPIDEDRGGIRSISPNFNQASTRENLRTAMYGVKAEYENKLKRVLPDLIVADLMAMLTVGWANASAEARERDASNYLNRYLSPAVVFDNENPDQAAKGALSGVSMKGKPNGTFDVEEDLPTMQHYAMNELGMDLSNPIMMLPRNAWPFMNMKKGYRRFVGRDGEPIRQVPRQTEDGPGPALEGDERYGINPNSAGFDTPGQARSYLAGSREGEAARAASALPTGPQPFLPRRVPNLLDEFVLPNSALGPMRVVLTKHESTSQLYYSSPENPQTDDITGNARSVMTTDIMIYDGNRPMYLIETVPPTSWQHTNGELRRSSIVMVEGYGMAPPTARGQQAMVIKNAVLEDNWSHDIWLEASNLKDTDHPMDGGMTPDRPDAS